METNTENTSVGRTEASVGSATGSGLPCECLNWCRTDIGFRDGKPLPFTEHHPRCPRVDDSLIDVWRVCVPGENGGCVCGSEAEAHAMVEDEDNFTITKERMHREIFENLPEFAGW